MLFIRGWPGEGGFLFRGRPGGGEGSLSPPPGQREKTANPKSEQTVREGVQYLARKLFSGVEAGIRPENSFRAKTIAN